MMEPEVDHGEAEVHTRVQAWDQGAARLACPGFPDLNRVTSRGPSHNSTSRPFTH